MNKATLLLRGWGRLLSLGLIGVLALGIMLASPANKAHASGGPGPEVWTIYANGYVGELDFVAANRPDVTNNPASLTATWYGDVFGNGFIGYRIPQPDGTQTISFLRLPLQTAGYITSFQVYNGTETADGQLMYGTFRVFTGTRTYSTLLRQYFYSYTVQSPIYAWSAYAAPYNGEPGIGAFATWFNIGWHLNANGWPGSILIDTSIASDDPGHTGATFGSVFDDGMVGLIPAAPCSSNCSAYFVRATTTDFSGFQIYNGVSSGSSMTGIFVEDDQGSSGPNYGWSANNCGGSC
jgi:hypothetical protein